MCICHIVSVLQNATERFARYTGFLACQVLILVISLIYIHLFPFMYTISVYIHIKGRDNLRNSSRHMTDAAVGPDARNLEFFGRVSTQNACTSIEDTWMLSRIEIPPLHQPSPALRHFDKLNAGKRRDRTQRSARLLPACRAPLGAGRRLPLKGGVIAKCRRCGLRSASQAQPAFDAAEDALSAWRLRGARQCGTGNEP